MSEEQLKELQEYNLEYLEALNSEEIFGGDYTSAVELKYAKKEIERLHSLIKELKLELSGYRQAILQDKEMLGLKSQLQQKENIIKEVRKKIESVRIFGLKSGKTLIATLLNDILKILDKGE